MQKLIFTCGGVLALLVATGPAKAQNNPYLNQLRSQQRLYQQQRQAYANWLRYGVYSPNVRRSSRGAMSHHQHGRQRSRAYGTNPYLNLLRSQQRVYQQRRQAYSNWLRYGVYSPNLRGGYRGAMSHHHHGRRRW